MAGPENSLKKGLLSLMGTRWDVQSHEDKYSVGIPDLSYGAKGVNGWIELKQVPSWPIKHDTLVKPSKYTIEQVNWIRKRGKKAGHCYILVRVSAEYFLFSWQLSRAVRTGMTREEYRKLALATWSGKPDPDQFIELITRPN